MVFGGQILYDSYDRKARLAPALLAVVPLLAAALFSFDNAALVGRLASLLVAVGVLWLLVDMSRGLGRAKQQQLFAKWGGMPSIQLLRHADRTIAPLTKARYHVFLGTKAKVQLPTPEEEAADPQSADAVYDSALQWLLQNTRDKKRFALLAAENATYGFRRNGYGMRWIGLVICVLASLWVIRKAFLVPSVSLLSLVLEPTAAAQLSLCMALSVVWLFYFGERMVRDAAFTYAHELIRSCEVIGGATAARKTRASAAKKSSSQAQE
ncbi:hypothetical protein [Ralstonia solanacearum]|uniref:hypothetical protein n=1 Tax=Ralstonia solanacearum TaxID=305 RepID=UPI003CC636E7